MKMKVVIDTQTYEVEIEDIHARPVVATVEGERFEVWPEAETPAPLVSAPDLAPASATAPVNTASSGKEVTAPLPGVIVAIQAKPGDSVTRGQELCTLEAMKMKNAIRSSRDGKLASIEVVVGDQVGHGQVLMTFSD